jgi:hypothetical protein
MRKNKFLAFGSAFYFLLSNSILNYTGIDKKSVVRIKNKKNYQIEVLFKKIIFHLYILLKCF